MDSDKFNSFGQKGKRKPLKAKRASTASLQAKKTTTPGQVKKTRAKRTTLASLPVINLTPQQLPLHQLAQQIDGCDYNILPGTPGTGIDIDLYRIFLENYGFINQYSDPLPNLNQIQTQLRINGLWRNLNNYPVFDDLFTLKQLKWYCCYSIQFYLDYRHDFNGVMTTVEKSQLCTQMHTDLYCVLQRFTPLQQFPLLPLYTLGNIYTNPTILGFYNQNNPYFIFLNQIFENVGIDFDANRDRSPQLLERDYNDNGLWPNCTYTSKEYLQYTNDTPTNLESKIFNFILNPTNNILSIAAVRQQVPITIYPRIDFVTIYSENNISDQFNNPDVINLYSEYLSAIMGIQKIDFKRLKRTIFGNDNSKNNDQLIKTLIHVNSNNNIRNINDNNIINGTNRSYFIGVDALSSNEKINPLTAILNSTITYEQPPIRTGRNTYNFPNNSVETNNYNRLSIADQTTINNLLTSNPPDPIIIGNFNPNIRLRDNLVIAQRTGRGAISTANPNVLTNLYTVPFQNINTPNNWNHYFTSDIDILDGAAANNNIRKTLSPFMINNPVQDDQTRSLPNNSQIDYVRTDIHYNIFFNVRTGNGTTLLIPNIIDLTLNGRPNIYDVTQGPKQTTLTINCFLKYHNLPNFNSDNFGLIPKTLSIANINTFIGFNQNTIQNISYRIYKTALDYIKILNFWSAINGKFNFSNPLQYDLNIDNTEKYGFLYGQNVITPNPFIITNNNSYNNFFILNDIVAADKSSIMIPSTIVIEGSENFGEFHDNSLKFFLRSYKLKQFWNNFIPTMVNPHITRPPFNVNPLFPVLHINQGGFGKKRWIQQAIEKQKQKGTTGSFKRWCKSKGFGDKVTLKCINEAKRSKNKTIRQKANFAKNILYKNIIKQINSDIKYLLK